MTQGRTTVLQVFAKQRVLFRYWSRPETETGGNCRCPPTGQRTRECYWPKNLFLVELRKAESLLKVFKTWSLVLPSIRSQICRHKFCRRKGFSLSDIDIKCRWATFSFAFHSTPATNPCRVINMRAYTPWQGGCLQMLTCAKFYC